jgi:hypothetical protein
MSKRTVSEIQTEYTTLCTRAGHLNYSIFALGLDLALVQEQLKELNLEGAAAQKAEADAKAESETPVA